MKLAVLLFGLFMFVNAFGQGQHNYDKFVKEAWSLYEAKEFNKSSEKYAEAFEQLEGKAYTNDRYNAACSYALAKDM